MIGRLALVAALLVALLLVACKGGDKGGDSLSTLEEALKAMVLAEEDLPEGLLVGEATINDNEKASGGSEERAALLEEWGRQLGYDVAYVQGSGQVAEPAVKGINVSASLYRTAAGATASFADAVKSAEETDWAANYAGLSGFMQEEIDGGGRADEIGWLRFSGFQPADAAEEALVTDDLIYFRIGRERGFLRVLSSSTETTDRGYLHETVEGWLGALLDKVEDALSAGGFDEDEG